MQNKKRVSSEDLKREEERERLYLYMQVRNEVDLMSWSKEHLRRVYDFIQSMYNEEG